ncbi:hypothetical protein B0T17DRAFT_506193 [Bombardia bombarda]|uniref:J domain-containing protein n=1 Tax=Bombardia bombarda TaxID=252184 RepID=A0AA39X9N3_9PEZI|nr:hypothetical protein B0T17DRAFT_506193 [Bombardia bombarda]
MVKLDYDRDYYSDLDLTPSADLADIKRQFKKLALKWHPDRNPGKEAWARDRFLIIQAAHEILTDPASKARFDQFRTRSNRVPRGSGVPGSSGAKGNPFQNVSKDMADRFGAPPTRRQPQPPPRSAPTAAAGSSRYANWGVPPNTKSKMDSASDNLRAWDRMRTTSSNKPAQAAGAGASAPPPPTAHWSRPENNKPPPTPPPRTAAQARRAEAAFGTRRTGFAPTSPLGDEGQAKTKHQYTNLNGHFDEPGTKGKNTQQPEPDFLDPLSKQFGETFMDNRQSTPYASHIGEKTNPFEGASLNRAKSVRESWRRFQEPDEDAAPPPPQRQRSASVGESDGFKTPKEKATPNGPSSRPPFPPSRASSRYSPRPAEGNSAPPTATFAAPGSSASSFNSSVNATVNGGASSKGTGGGPTVYDPTPNPPRDDRNTHPTPPTHPNSHTMYSNGRASEGSSYPRDFSYYAGRPDRDGRTTPSGERSPTRGLNSFEKGLNAQLQHLLGKLKGHAKKTVPPRDGALSPKKNGHRVNKRTNATHHASFSIPVDDETFNPSTPNQQARFMRNSADNINTRFVAEEKAGENYQFNAGGDTPENDPFLRAKQRSRSTPRSARQSPPKHGYESSTESFQNVPQQNDVPPKPTSFDADEWSAKIGPHHFVPPPINRPSMSPTRGSRPTKKPRPVRMTAGTAGLVDDEETSSEEKTRPPTAADDRAYGPSSPNAMDIDTPPPVEPDTPQPQGARTINVEPSKPEWRAGHVNGVKPDADPTQGAPTMPTMPASTNNAGSEDSDEFFKPMLKELRNVEPFAPSGLNSFSDLKSNLPFESKPSARIPIKQEKPKPLNFPHPPVAPRPPPVLAISSLKPNAVAWAKYMSEFELYQNEWDVFNKRIVDHFAARQRVSEEKKKQGLGWLNTLGDAGIQETLRWYEEDKMVRQRWMAACDQHELHVREFMKHRDRMKQ